MLYIMSYSFYNWKFILLDPLSSISTTPPSPPPSGNHLPYWVEARRDVGLGLAGAAEPLLVLFTGRVKGVASPHRSPEDSTWASYKARLWVTARHPCSHISQSSARRPSGLSLLSLPVQPIAPPGHRASKRGHQVLTGSGLKVLQATGSAPCLSRL